LLRRPRSGRKLGGVAAGLAENFGASVTAVRVGFVVFSLFGLGLVLYLWLWIMVPSGDTNQPPPALARLAPRLHEPARARWLAQLGAGLALLAVAALIAAAVAGVPVPWEWFMPAMVLAGAIWLAWSQLEKADAGARRTSGAWLRISGALALVVVAVTLLMAPGTDLRATGATLLAGLACLAAAALVLAPWGLRLLSALGDQKAATAREAERADIAAHLHDSVLQTLAVIRAQAEDPAAVRRLARSQERELREWLYQDRPAPGVSVAEALRRVAGEVEDATGVEIGVVLVGDHSPNPALEAMVSATREALFNAARHGAPPVSLYAELSPGAAEVFVRDRGPGFELDAVPVDRLGVRESILGRVRRCGGRAEIRSRPGQGTEIRLHLALAPAPQPTEPSPSAPAPPQPAPPQPAPPQPVPQGVLPQPASLPGAAQLAPPQPVPPQPVPQGVLRQPASLLGAAHPAPPQPAPPQPVPPQPVPQGVLPQPASLPSAPPQPVPHPSGAPPAPVPAPPGPLTVPGEGATVGGWAASSMGR
jgi:signal transduction histidine kinase